MQLQLLFCTRSPSKKNSIKIQEWQPLLRTIMPECTSLISRNFTSLCIFSIKMFHVFLYLELSRFFLSIAKEIGKKTFSQIFQRKSARLVRRDYFTFNLETNYWNSNSNFISCVFYEKTISTKALITSRKHRRIDIMEYVKLESQETERSQVHTNSGLGKQQDICWILFN